MFVEEDIDGGGLTDVVAKDFAVTFCSAFAESFTAFSTTYHALSAPEIRARSSGNGLEGTLCTVGEE